MRVKEMQVFKNSEFGELGVITSEGKEYFPATECAKMLGYTNPHKAIRDHCKGVNETLVPTNGGQQRINLISEGDLYRLIVRSKLPSAERFESWVFDQVLPDIRKHGLYATENVIDQMLTNPDAMIELLVNYKREKEENKRLSLENERNKQLVGELKPKVEYLDKILQSKSLVTITQIAKDYGMSGRTLNNILYGQRVQYKQSGQWLLYSKYQDKGYTHSETMDVTRPDGTTKVVMNTKWTQKGRIFLYELLKKIDILPEIEK